MDKNLIPFVTVVMPVYNAELYLRESIESVLCQTFSDFEFHIIDDGSIDSSVEIIKSYSDSRIYLWKNQTNKGVTQTLNEAYERINTKYIARMDADDIALSHRLQTQINFMEKNPEISIAGSWFSSTNFEIQYKPPTKHDDIAVGLLENSQIGHPTIIIRNETWKKNKLSYSDDFLYAEDYECWCSSVIKGLKLANIPEFLLLYRSHEQQISTSKNLEQIKSSYTIRTKYFHSNFPNLNENDLFIYENLISGNFKIYANYKSSSALIKCLIKANLSSKKLSDTSLRLFLSNRLKKGALDFYCKIIDPSPILFLFAFLDSKFYRFLTFSQILKFPFKLLIKIFF